MKRNIKLIAISILASFIFISNSAHADSLGQVRNFFVNKDFDKLERTSVQFTLKYVSEKAYFYVDDGYWSNLSSVRQSASLNSIKQLADEFDRVIYPKETSFFGTESNPGIDNDPRAVIALQNLEEGYGGYFDSIHSYRKKEAEITNEREMLFISIHAATEDLNLARMFLAHEFLHLISFHYKEHLNDVVEDVWLNEARAEYAVSISGYNSDLAQSSLARRKETFLENPSDSLTEWQNKYPDYATALIFSYYLSEQYGPNILGETLKYGNVGIASINEYLASKDYGERFQDIFVEWMAANYLNDTTVSPRLGYKNPLLKDLRVSPTVRHIHTGLLDIDQGIKVKPWQPAWVEFTTLDLADNTDKSARLDIYGQMGQNFVGGYVVFYENARPEFGRIKMIGNEGSAYILNSPEKKISKVVVLAAHSSKTSGFGASEIEYSATLRLAIVDTSAIKSNQIKDGDLIKKAGQAELYVVDRGYRRYLSPEVIKLYGHLDPAKAITVSSEVFNSYKTSNYIKNVNDEKVYATWPDNTKHWLNITPQQWDASHRDWNAIFIINELELNYYKVGVNITR